MKNSNMVFEKYPDVVNFSQFREMLGNIGKDLGYRLLKENKINSFKIGRSYRILKSEIIEYLIKQ